MCKNVHYCRFGYSVSNSSVLVGIVYFIYNKIIGSGEFMSCNKRVGTQTVKLKIT